VAKSLVYRARARGQRTGTFGKTLAMLKRRLLESLGFGVLLACLLLTLGLLTYDPRDGSLNTAVDAAPHNFLGRDGAVVADLLWQSLGLASFLIPLLLLAWAFRLLLNRPLSGIWPRFALLPIVLALGALALSILHLGTPSLPAGPGGALGWAMQRLLSHSGLGPAALPISMAAAALVGLLLLATMGLSLRDWRDIGEGAGRGAGRIAALTGRGSVAASWILGRLLRGWSRSRFLCYSGN
jgi:DNA segregation ATPase FtsK/SpoIIIE, S-DNA-T family